MLRNATVIGNGSCYCVSLQNSLNMQVGKNKVSPGVEFGDRQSKPEVEEQGKVREEGVGLGWSKGGKNTESDRQELQGK